MPSERAESPKLHFFGTRPDEFDHALTELGWPKFRGKQVRDWAYGKLLADPAAMSNLSARDRDDLRARVAFAEATITRRQSSGDGTEKLLLTWEPDALPPALPTDDSSPTSLPLLTAPARPAAPAAETVMIPDGDRRTACVSSQVGCPVGCAFCASGINGVKGNLSAAQIVEQVYQLNLMLEGRLRSAPASPGGATGCEDDDRDVATSFDPPEVQRRDHSRDGGRHERKRRPGTPPMPFHDPAERGGGTKAPFRERPNRITNVVFMGMGEPLANYKNVMQAIRVLHDPQCFNLGARRITISTVGVPPRMRELAHEDLPLNLAISLHAPNEPLRRQLIPWAEHFALEDILDAARYYFDRTGREVTLEYILLHNVNDRPEHARQLAKLCKTLRANVNLIRYNEVESLPFQRPKADDVMTFQTVLRNAGVNAHVRKSRGRDIDAACGQLRRKQEREAQPAGAGA